ncbi:MAG TPA: AP endonuclease, partial [Enterococcus sp.]|nr:AP endonuclease [Enterococcus sp.]
LKDFQLSGEEVIPVPLGEGQMRYPEILQLLIKHKPYCYVVLEETKDAGIDRAVALIEERVGQGGSYN